MYNTLLITQVDVSESSGGCQGNENRFSSRQECEDVCSGTSSILDLQNQIPREISTGVFGPTPTLSPETDCKILFPGAPPLCAT